MTTSGRFVIHPVSLCEEQRAALEVIQKNHITIITGIAGTGKTRVAVHHAIEKLSSGNIRHVVLCRPAVPAGEKLGYLEGGINEKIGPYMMPIYDLFDEMLGDKGPARDEVTKAIKLAPVAYLRGRTFRNSIIILDEAQNLTKSQMHLALTRIGRGSQIIVTGDPIQSDLPEGQRQFAERIERLSGIPGIGIVHLTQQHRHPLIDAINEAFTDPC